MMKQLRQFICHTALCAGIPARLPVLRHDIHVVGRMAKPARPRLGRIGESIR